MSLAVTLGKAVQTWRKHRGYTQAKLAERAGFSMQTVSNIEHGEGTSLAGLEMLARALLVEPEVLLTDWDDETMIGERKELATFWDALDYLEPRDLEILAGIAKLMLERAAERRARAGGG